MAEATFEERVSILQLFHAGRISRREAIRRLGLVDDVDAELERIDHDRIVAANLA